MPKFTMPIGKSDFAEQKLHFLQDHAVSVSR